ncbi:hypothetical protein F5884DRAFT_418131 [Xylogone sp. PMI_703]|nr:hypothetical protein F5884DRAFT_418131 [Xylogone sp. PMI_703]
MLAIRDQENLVHGQQTAAAAKPLNQGVRGLQPKTPGNRYPKTPLKVPLNDENAPAGFGGKSVLKTKGKGAENLIIGGKDKNAFVTPLGPRNRAPLGAKTTNAKAKVLQTPAGPAAEKGPEKTQPKQPSANRLKSKVPHAEFAKLHIHGDEPEPAEERDVEYCPPRPKDLPYESEDFPDGCLNLEPLKPENLLGGFSRTYLYPRDENGLNRIERAHKESAEKAAKLLEESVLKSLEEDWTVGDVPETFVLAKKKRAALQAKDTNVKPATSSIKKGALVTSKGANTLTAKQAASALSMMSKPATTTSKPKPKPSTTFLSGDKRPITPVGLSSTTMRHTAATAASKSTIGYTKGRSASSVLHKRTASAPARRELTRSASAMSNGSDATITPARLAQNAEEEERRRPAFLAAFDLDLDDDEDLEPGLKGVLSDRLRFDDDDEEFVMTLNA